MIAVGLVVLVLTHKDARAFFAAPVVFLLGIVVAVVRAVCR